MNPTLTAAIDVFRSLGWDKALPEQATTLPLGSREQQKIAREGLSKGEWEEVTANRAMLSFLAIRVGITPRRAAQIAPWDHLGTLADVLATKDEVWVQEFIRLVCRSDRRAWENAVSTFGTVAVELVTRMGLSIPESVEYLKDWAGVVAGHLSDYPVQMLREQLTAKDALEDRFWEHLSLAATLGAPMTGPLGVIPTAALAEGWLTREEALSTCFTGIEFAVRPGDRKRWAEIITGELAASDEELLTQSARLIPIISTVETPMVELLGLRLLPLLPAESWVELALVMTYASAAKTLISVLQSIAKNTTPSADTVAALAPRLEELTAHKNAKVAKLSTQLLAGWGQTITAATPEEAVHQYVWHPYPGFQEPHRVDLPNVASVETITPLLAHVRDERESNIHVEMFWAQLVRLCHRDPATAKRAVAGLKTNPYLHAWSQDQQIPHPLIPETTRRKAYFPVEARNVSLLQHLGSRPVPCLLSQPSLEDMSIDPKDLLARLKEYATSSGAQVILADLLLALARVRVPKEGVGELQKKFRAVNLPIEGISRTAGQVVADYLADPFVDPRAHPWDGKTHPAEPEIPASLEDCVDLEESRAHAWRTRYAADVTVFPLFRDSLREYLPYDEKWLKIIDRFGSPLPPSVASLFLVPEKITTEYQEALTRAWQRGVIVPGTWSFMFDMYRDSEFPKKAATLRLNAELGALAAVWPLLDSMLGQHATKPRVPTGAAHLAELALELAPVVAKALAEGVATKEQAPTAGLKALAAKGGSSQAVRIAIQALQFFPEELAADSEEQKASMSEAEFAEAWPIFSRQAHNPADGFTISLALVAGSSQDQILQVRLSKGTETYVIEDGGSLGTLKREGQTRGEKPDGSQVWLRWDETKESLVANIHRNWMRNDDTPPDSSAEFLLSDSLIAVAIAHMQDRPRVLYPDGKLWSLLMQSHVGEEGIAAAMSKLLESPVFNPTRTFAFIEKNPRLLPDLWPVLTLCLAHAAEQETPPRWTPRCLDALTTYAPVLATATAKGMIPAGALESLRVLAGGKKRSAARTKAQHLVGALLVT